MDASNEETLATVYDFVIDYLEDVDAGDSYPLSHYLARFPGFEDSIATEYLRLRREAAAEGGTPVPPDGERRVGHYTLIRELGSGGQGQVWLAEDTKIERQVALKLLRGGFVTEDRRKRFRREAESIARLQHPGVCAIHEADIDGETPYIAMQFVDGVDVGTALEEVPDIGEKSIEPLVPWEPDNRTDLHRLLLFFERAARALHAAHEAGVVHRDIKPGNIVVNPAGEPVLLDFGLAQDERDDSEALTMSGEVFGTPVYMSPEQLRGAREDLDRRTDVYSLGTTLYEALTRRRPFEGQSRFELEQAILFNPVPDPRAFNPILDEDIKVVLETALEKDPDRRYATALDFAEDLRRIRQWEPVHARPAGQWLRLRRWARRQPALATSVIGTIVLLATALAITLTLLAEVQHALDLADGRRLAERTVALLDFDPAASLAVGIEAVRLAPDDFQSRSALYAPLEACSLERVFDLEDANIVWDLRLSDDGTLVAGAANDTEGSTEGDDGTARVWEIATGALVLRHDVVGDVVRRVVFDPAGRRLVIGTAEGIVRVLDVTTGDVISDKDLGAGTVLWIDSSSDGTRLAVQTEHSGALILSSDLEEILRLPTPEGGSGRAVFSPGDERVLTASLSLQGEPRTASRSAMLWDAREGRLIAELAGHTEAIQWATFDGSGDRIATASADGTVRLWDGQTGDPAGEPLDHGDVLVYCVAFSPSSAGGAGRLVTTTGAGPNSSAWMWDIGTGTKEELAGHTAPVVHAAFSHDGSRVVTTSYDRTVRIWDGRTGDAIKSCLALSRPLRTMWTPDGKRLISLTQSFRTLVWNARNVPDVYRLRGHGCPVHWATFTHDGRRAITAGEDGSVRVWHTPATAAVEDALEPGALLAVLDGHEGPVRGGVLGPGERLLTWSDDGSVRIWDLGRGEEAHTPLVHDAPIADVRLHPFGELVATLDAGGGAWLWRLDGSREPLRVGEGEARLVRFTADGRWLVTAIGGTVRVHGAASAGLEREIVVEPGKETQATRVVSLACNPAFSEIAVGTRDTRVRYFDPATGEPLRLPRTAGSTPFRPTHRWTSYSPSGESLLVYGENSTRVDHLRTNVSVYLRASRPEAITFTHQAFDPEGERVVTASEDGTVFVWNAADGEVLSHFTLHTGAVGWAAFSPVEGDTRVIAASVDGTASVWPVDPVPAALARQPRELDDWEREMEFKKAPVR